MLPKIAGGGCDSGTAPRPRTPDRDTPFRPPRVPDRRGPPADSRRPGGVPGRGGRRPAVAGASGGPARGRRRDRGSEVHPVRRRALPVPLTPRRPATQYPPVTRVRVTAGVAWG